MWKQRLKKLFDNPAVVFSYFRNRLFYSLIADSHSKEYRAYNFINTEETLKAILKNNQSLLRVGDGTFGYLQGSSIYFNDWHFRYNKTFAGRLDFVLREGQKNNILFCYPHRFILKSKQEFAATGQKNEWPIWVTGKVMLKKYLQKDKVYGDSFCFNPKYTSINFQEIQRYLNGKHVFIITSNTARFKDVTLGKTTTLINAPSSDSWQVYEDLEKITLEKIRENSLHPEEVLIMISAAEAAKVMVYDFTTMGYIAWDTGQFFDLAAKEIKKII